MISAAPGGCDPCFVCPESRTGGRKNNRKKSLVENQKSGDLLFIKSQQAPFPGLGRGAGFLEEKKTGWKDRRRRKAVPRWDGFPAKRVDPGDSRLFGRNKFAVCRKQKVPFPGLGRGAGFLEEKKTGWKDRRRRKAVPRRMDSRLREWTQRIAGFLGEINLPFAGSKKCPFPVWEGAPGFLGEKRTGWKDRRRRKAVPRRDGFPAFGDGPWF